MFVQDVKHILTRSFSMMSIYLGLLLFVSTDQLYYRFGFEIDVYVVGRCSIAFMILGVIGRIVDQKKSSFIRLAVFFAFCATILYSAAHIAAGVVNTIEEPQDYSNLEPQELVHKAMSQVQPSKEVAAVTILPEAVSGFEEMAFVLIARWEGKKNYAYFDIVGVPTICYGHTRTVTASMVHAKVTWSDARCKQLLIDEIAEYRREVKKYMSKETLRSRLPVTRDVAFTSLAFNIGWGAVSRSTALRRLNAGDIQGSCEAITWFNKAGGYKVRGLVLRRTSEYKLCIA